LGIEPTCSRGILIEEDSKNNNALIEGGRGGFWEMGRVLGPHEIREAL